MQARRQQGASDWQLYGRLLSYLRPHWHFFLFSMLGYTLYSLCTVLLVDVLQLLMDALNDSEHVATGLVSGFIYWLFAGQDMGPLELARIAVPVAILVLTSARACGFFAGTYYMSLLTRNLIHQLRCELFNKMLEVPTGYYDSHSQGALISKITFNVEQVAEATGKAFKTILRESLTVLGLISYMLYLNWRLCLLFLAVMPVIAWVVRLVGKRFRRYSRRIQSSMGDVTQISNESIAAYREVRMFGGQAQQRQRFFAASDYNRVQSLKLALANALSTPVIQSLLAMSLAVLVWLSLSPSMLTGFSAGSLIAFLTAASQLGKPVRQLSGVQTVIQRGLAAAEDIFLQIDQESEIDTGTVHIQRARGNIGFEQVSFSYPGSEIPALDEVTLEITAGQTIALVGRSGSGKSTLTQLLTRFYRPQQGRILLDGIPIEDYELDNLRQQIAIVSQDVPLFRDSVYNNIAYGALAGHSNTQVQQAARAAQAMAFIEQLPQGFQTQLNDDGAGLSGGERQRIAIARAILKDAPILVLDEATSALDYESEHYIQRALDSIMADRTAIIIAHRLSTVERADVIVVVDAGRIIASGSHAQLLRQGGLYAQLYRQEFSE